MKVPQEYNIQHSQIRVHPKMSTGLWDGAFHSVCTYRSDGERMTSSHLELITSEGENDGSTRIQYTTFTDQISPL